MSRRIIEIVKSTRYAGDMYEIKINNAPVSYSLGLYCLDDLLYRLRQMTFSDGSTAERIVEAAKQIGQARAEIEWPVNRELEHSE
ncbi:MAG TPA: hypothetical protein VF133_07040 [Terriglobales bacterium]